MFRKRKITDTSLIVCKHKISCFKNDEELAEFKEAKFNVEDWKQKYFISERYKKIGVIVSLIAFIITMILIMNICVLLVN